MQQQLIMVCRACGTFWPADAEPACREEGHPHQRMEVHRHLDPVQLPDGTEVIGVSFDLGDPYRREQTPDFGLYLDPRWQPPWPHDHLDWPDFGVPQDPERVRSVLGQVLARARSGERVEIGCLGGHGRTGTALAGLVALSGLPAEDAVDYVRDQYCPRAVETAEQETYVDLLFGSTQH